MLIGDGIKYPKEGRRMPGVKRLHQESESQSKSPFIFGHMCGAVSIVTGFGKHLFSTPLSIRIHDGLKALNGWSPNRDFISHVVELAKDACACAEKFTSDCQDNRMNV